MSTFFRHLWQQGTFQIKRPHFLFVFLGALYICLFDGRESTYGGLDDFGLIFTLFAGCMFACVPFTIQSRPDPKASYLSSIPFPTLPIHPRVRLFAETTLLVFFLFVAQLFFYGIYKLTVTQPLPGFRYFLKNFATAGYIERTILECLMVWAFVSQGLMVSELLQRDKGKAWFIMFVFPGLFCLAVYSDLMLFPMGFAFCSVFLSGLLFALPKLYTVLSKRLPRKARPKQTLPLSQEPLTLESMFSQNFEKWLTFAIGIVLVELGVLWLGKGSGVKELYRLLFAFNLLLFLKVVFSGILEPVSAWVPFFSPFPIKGRLTHRHFRACSVLPLSQSELVKKLYTHMLQKGFFLLLTICGLRLLHHFLQGTTLQPLTEFKFFLEWMLVLPVVANVIIYGGLRDLGRFILNTLFLVIYTQFLLYHHFMRPTLCIPPCSPTTGIISFTELGMAAVVTLLFSVKLLSTYLPPKAVQPVAAGN